MRKYIRRIIILLVITVPILHVTGIFFKNDQRQKPLVLQTATSLPDTLLPPSNLNVDPLTLVAAWSPPELLDPEERDTVLRYDVYLDDTLVGLTTATAYQYDPSLVNWGQEHIAAVCAVYESGTSEKIYYTFTSVFLPPPCNFQAEVQSFDRVHIQWDSPHHTGGEYGDLTGYAVYSNYGGMIGITPAGAHEFFYRPGQGMNYYSVTALYDNPTSGESMKAGPIEVYGTPGIAYLTITVKEALTGVPLKGVTGIIEDALSNKYIRITDSNGQFNFEPRAGIPYTITSIKTGYDTCRYGGLVFMPGISYSMVMDIHELLLPPRDFRVNSMTGEANWLPPMLDYKLILFEGFEKGTIPNGWLQDYISGSLSWITYQGSPSGIPATAHTGQSNAVLYGSTGTTRLVTTTIDIKHYLDPKLIFSHFIPQGGSVVDELHVFYKQSIKGYWHHLRTYTDTTEIWITDTLALPSPTDDYYIGFYGKIAGAGSKGICIDDLRIIGGEIPDMYNNNRKFIYYKAFLDSVFFDTTSNTACVFTGLQIGQTYQANVQAIYSTGQSGKDKDIFTFYPCYYFEKPDDLVGIVMERRCLLAWEPPTETNTDFLGYRVWRDGESITDNLIQMNCYIDIPFPCGFHQYNVTKVYNNGESCLYNPWIGLTTYSSLEGPLNFNGSWTPDSVYLCWDTVGTPLPVWIHWDDGINYYGIGQTSGGNFMVASRWTAEDLNEYDGYSLVKVSFFPKGEVTELYIRVWTGENASNLVVDMPVEEIVVDDWNVVTLETPVLIDASQEFWFGYACLNQPAGEYPAGCDDGPAIAGKGDMIYTPDLGWEPLSSIGLDYNWNLQGLVIKLTDSDEIIPLSRKLSGETSLNFSSKPDFSVLPSAKMKHFDKSVILTPLGYQLYKNGVRYALLPPEDTSFCDQVTAPGNYQYYLSAVYNSGESCEAGPVTITIESGDLKGKVYDHCGSQSPVNQAIVVIEKVNESAVTNCDGLFHINHLAAGKYEIVVSAMGYTTRTINDVIIYPDQVTEINIPLYDTLILDPPLREFWNSGSFVEHKWTLYPSLGNWWIDTDTGNPLPMACFHGFPVRENYLYTLQSAMVNISGTKNFVDVQYDIKNECTNPTGAEILKVTIGSGCNWHLLAEYTNDHDRDWTTVYYRIPKEFLDDPIQLKFQATGTNSADISYWCLDNIIVKAPDTAILQGIVTDLAYGLPLDSVEVHIPGYTDACTDSTGFYAIMADEGFHNVSFNRSGYNILQIDSLYITDTTIRNAALTRPVMHIEPLSVMVTTLDPFYDIQYVTIYNNGNGVLDWNATIEYTDTVIRPSGDVVPQYLIKHPEWLYLDNYFGTIQPGTSQEVGLHFIIDFEMQWWTWYLANVYFASDPDVGVITVEAGFMICEDIAEPSSLVRVSIYPNPANSTIIIESAGPLAEIEILSHTGQILYEKHCIPAKHFEIDVSALPEGLYLLKCTACNGQVFARKLVVLR